CPHWGYHFKGKIVVRYADHEETINAGQPFYMAPGHVPEALEDWELVQYSPTDQMKDVIATMQRNAQAMNPSGGRRPHGARPKRFFVTMSRPRNLRARANVRACSAEGSAISGKAEGDGDVMVRARRFAHLL